MEKAIMVVAAIVLVELYLARRRRSDDSSVQGFEQARAAMHTAAKQGHVAVAERSSPPTPARPQPSRAPTPGPGGAPRFRPRPETVPLVRLALVAVLVVGALGLIVTRWGGGGSDDAQPSQTAAAPTTSAPSPPAAPPTTAPPPPAVQLAANSREVSYAVQRSPFTLTLAAKDRCWVRVRSATGRASLFEGMLQPGETREFPGAGALQVRVGSASNISVALDRIPLDFPNPGPRPLNLSFTIAPR